MEVEELAKRLNITIDEARQVQEDDKRIDRGEKLFELSPELEAGAKKARQTGTRKVTETKRERKPDEDKRWLIQYLAGALEDADCDLDTNLDNISITNPEREMEFIYNGRKYRLTLACPRK